MAGLEHHSATYDECDLRSLPNRVFSLWLVPTKSYRGESEKKTRAWKLREAIEAQDSVDHLARLEAAAAFGNSHAFFEELKSIDWHGQSGADFMRAIDLCLRMGAHVAARDLSGEGAALHFDNEELQKYARILAPPAASNKRPSGNAKPKANLEWLKANRHEYTGQWVAIKDGTLLASANSHEELIAQVGETKGRGILVTNLY